MIYLEKVNTLKTGPNIEDEGKGQTLLCSVSLFHLLNNL